MGIRKPNRNREQMRTISVRIARKDYDNYVKQLEDTSLRSLSEVIRKILKNRVIKHEYRDASLDDIMEELSKFRFELLAIGVNVNQLTKRFNAEKWQAAMIQNGEDLKVYFDSMERLLGSYVDYFTKIIKQWLPE